MPFLHTKKWGSKFDLILAKLSSNIYFSNSRIFRISEKFWSLSKIEVLKYASTYRTNAVSYPTTVEASFLWLKMSGEKNWDQQIWRIEHFYSCPTWNIRVAILHNGQRHLTLPLLSTIFSLPGGSKNRARKITSFKKDAFWGVTYQREVQP